jgi:O-methyltransferase
MGHRRLPKNVNLRCPLFRFQEEYDAYYESCLKLIRPGGLILVDNALWSGAVADPSKNDSETAAIRALNAKIRDDVRVEACLLTVGDGVMLARKRLLGSGMVS